MSKGLIQVSILNSTVHQ